jgi:hypothetical protein
VVLLNSTEGKVLHELRGLLYNGVLKSSPEGSGAGHIIKILF